MGELKKLSDTYNHRWKSDPLFVQGFDYDCAKYANVPGDQKWMIPLFEAQKDPAVIAEHKRVEKEAMVKVAREKLRLVKGR